MVDSWSDGVSRRCPRCPGNIERFNRSLTDGRQTTAEMCPDCGGIWLENENLSANYPDLYETVRGAAENAGVSMVDCPSDGNTMGSFVLQGISLDVCKECGGLWIDGNEVEQVDQIDGTKLIEESGGETGYRQAARPRALTDKSSVCPLCGREVAEQSLVESKEGKCCKLCAENIAEPLRIHESMLGKLLRKIGV